MTNQIELQRQQLARDRQTLFAEMEALKTKEAQFEVSQRDARAKLDNEHTALQAEKEKWAHINEIIATDFADSEVIELNVGGKFFTTSRHTLVKHPMSMLGAMFSGRHVLPRDSSGRVFIDRNGEVFGYLLDWLRTGRMPTIPPELEAAFAEEFDFFALEVKPHNPASADVKSLQDFQLVVSHPFMDDKSRKTSGLVPHQSGPLDTVATSERAVIATFPSEVTISGLTLSVLYGAKNGLCGDGGAVDYWDGSKWVEIAKIPSGSFMGQQQKTHRLSWNPPVSSSQWRIRGVTAATSSSAVFNRETPPSPPLGANLGINLLQFQ